MANTTLSVLLILTGCKEPEPEGYRVAGYDSATHQWIILRNGTFDGKYLRKRLTVICNFYKWGQHEAVSGEEACHLQVGELIVPNIMAGKAKDQEPVYVFEMPDEVLSITQAEGADQVNQQFKIIDTICCQTENSRDDDRIRPWRQVR